MGKTFTINSRDYTGTLKKSWECELVSRTGSLLTFIGIFERTVVHSQLGTIVSGTISYEYYWDDRWYNVFKFFEPDGAFRNFYCNINLPPVVGNGTLDYVDLDIDILVDSSGIKVLDQDEFLENADRFAYDLGVRKKAAASVEELMSMIGRLEFPFDSTESLQRNPKSGVLESFHPES